MPHVLACGLCPLTIRVIGPRLACWWCPQCGCFNTHAPERP